MPYTRYALFVFGAGALAGLVLVSVKLPTLGLVGSALMAAGLLFLPVALVGDWWSHRPWNDRKPASKRKSARRRAAPKRRQPRERR